MRLHRFYVVQPLGEELVVDTNSASLLHQWISVFRFTVGDEVLLFSEGSDKDFLYKFTSLSKKEAHLSFVDSFSQKKIIKKVTLYMALVKKDTFEKVVRQGTELGVSTIVPVVADRSEKKGLNLERLNAIAIEAAEQSGRGTVPALTDIIPFEKAISEARGENIFASLEGNPVMDLENLQSEISLWIGPEGGWSAQEEKAAEDAHFVKASLTDTVLKADTAAIALLSYLVLS